MTITLRAVTAEEYPDFHAALSLSFGGPEHEDQRELEATITEYDRTIAAYDGTRVVGTAGAFGLTMSVPGADARVAGVTVVTVAPTHRRQGLLTRMMTEQLADVRRRGEALAALWASEGAIYGRFGYGLASTTGPVSLPTARSAFIRAPWWPGRVRLVEPADARDVIAPAYEIARGQRPGRIKRSPAWWNKRLADLPHWRGDGSPLRVAVYEDGGACTGYALYRTHATWGDVGPDGKVDVREVLGVTSDATAALWRYLCDIDLMRTLVVPHEPPDTALLHLLADPRAARLGLGDNLWVRVVDVGPALEQRRYATADRLVLEVSDETCPWNAGRFLLEGAPDGATCRPTDAGPDLSFSARELGAVYLGGTRMSALAAAGRVVEHTAGAVARADLLFGWSPLPACPEIF
ncbi:MAG TPA: GNAT family N-acetyltransferase [Mycobacteriales bacterium]|nr:GNAT family N-acetyltransferase [Mycobacteriales bacterium]